MELYKLSIKVWFVICKLHIWVITQFAEQLQTSDIGRVESKKKILKLGRGTA